MYLKTAGFKRLIKAAYKGIGLTIGNDGEGYYLSGGYWVIWIKNGYIPKKELGAIIELAGELPNPGEAFRATEDGNQYEIVEKPYFKAMENATGCNRLLQTTKIIIVVGESHLRILQEPESGDVYALKESIIDMVDNKEIDKENGETPTDGPMLGEIPGIFWKNNIMALHVMWCDTENEKELMKHLAEIGIPEDV